MLDKDILVFNFDDSIVKQKGLLARYNNHILDLRDLGPPVRYYSSAKTRDLVLQRIKNCPKNSIVFFGSGDYHHISELLISRFEEPISVIDFDFHPDWDTLPPRYGCGSWVSEVLKRKNVCKFVLLGVSSEDISTFHIQTGNLNSLQNNRVEIYPYIHRPTSTFLKKIPENISVKVEKGILSNKIYWNELKGKNAEDFFYDLLKRIPVKKVYVSIDKDCLKNDYALTNWEEGKMPLDEILVFLRLIKKNLDIVGLDITGDYSPILVNGALKKVASYLDHPKNAEAMPILESVVSSINEDTNLKILEALSS